MNFSKKNILLIVFFGFLLHNFANAQTNDTIIADSVIYELPDTTLEQKKHIPSRATMYSAVLPGLGQIYNRQTWKVPFIYAAFAGIGYGIHWQHSNYMNYKKTYYHLNDNNPETTFYQDFLKIDIDEFDKPSTLNNQIIAKIEKFKRDRNLVIIGAAAFYLLNILDANVNAHFIDFDISEDLSLELQALPRNNYFYTQQAYGAVLTYNF